jgi:hypothetical protein
VHTFTGRRIAARLLAGRWAAARANPDRGAETVDKVLWVAVVIVVVGAVGLLFRDAITSYFNSLVIEIGFSAGNG